jgi:hypothetical protein
MLKGAREPIGVVMRTIFAQSEIRLRRAKARRGEILASAAQEAHHMATPSTMLESRIQDLLPELERIYTDIHARTKFSPIQEGQDGGPRLASSHLERAPFAARCKDCEEAYETVERRERVMAARRGSSALFLELPTKR